MGSTIICLNCCKCNRQMIIYSLMILLASTSIMTHVAFLAQARAISNQQIQASQIIGSRPPKCERRCTSCEKCEAVQIPIAPKEVQSAASGSAIFAYSRGDDIANYKPMSWKCKCGNRFFDP